MSDSSPYQPPEFPYPPGPSDKPNPPRPTSATVFGILNLAFAALGLCGSVAGVISLFATQLMPEGAPNPALELMKQNQAYYMFSIVMMGLSFVATIALALGGIGLLKMRAWGRTLSIGYAVYTILASIAGMIANWVWLIQPLMEQTDAMGPGPEKAAAIGGVIGGLFGGCISMIYPIVLLVFMMRPSFVQAFRESEAASF